MRSLHFASCLLLLLAMGCSPAAEPGAAAASAAGSSAPARDEATDAQAPATRPAARVADAAPDFSQLIAVYPARKLPREYPYEFTGGRNTLERYPIPLALQGFLLGEEKLELAAGEAIFALERLALEGDVTGLVTYIKGPEQHQYVLSTHMPDGEMISHVQVWMTSTALTYGYASSIYTTQRINRAMMITNDAGERDVDSFDDFVIESDGRISMTEQ